MQSAVNFTRYKNQRTSRYSEERTAGHLINHYFIVRQKGDQRAGQLSESVYNSNGMHVCYNSRGLCSHNLLQIASQLARVRGECQTPCKTSE